MKKILITGATGFLGKNVAYKLKNKYKIFICSRNLANGKNLERNLKVDFIPLNISNYSEVEEVLFNIKPNIIIHSAASKFVDISEKFALILVAAERSVSPVPSLAAAPVEMFCLVILYSFVYVIYI